MSTFIAIGSILLCSICFYYVISLWQKVKVLQSKIEQMNHFEKEIGELLITYIQEIKDENEKVLNTLNVTNGLSETGETESKITPLMISRNEVTSAYRINNDVRNETEDTSFHKVFQNEMK